MKIKICGLRRQEDISYVNEFMPDYIGFVFAKSKRQVSKESARTLKENLNPKIEAVGVFVNEDIDVVSEIANEKIIDIIQLHGDEDNNYIKNLRKLTNSKIIKALRIKDEKDLLIPSLDVDYLLLDAWDKDQYGGSGKTFDWTLIKNLNKPFFLAGGISELNLKEAIETANPYAIDISSSVETDGFKDRDKIKKIIQIIKEN